MIPHGADLSKTQSQIACVCEKCATAQSHSLAHCAAHNHGLVGPRFTLASSAVSFTHPAAIRVSSNSDFNTQQTYQRQPRLTVLDWSLGADCTAEFGINNLGCWMRVGQRHGEKHIMLIS